MLLPTLGGGSNFGVVAEFVMRLHPHPGKCFGGILGFTPDKLVDLVNAVNTVWDKRDPTIAFALGVAAPPPAFQV
jgi:hypothetical protein